MPPQRRVPISVHGTVTAPSHNTHVLAAPPSRLHPCNPAGIMLIDRNDELCVLYEKANIQDEVIQGGRLELIRRDDEARWGQQGARSRVRLELRHLESSRERRRSPRLLTFRLWPAAQPPSHPAAASHCLSASLVIVKHGEPYP